MALIIEFAGVPCCGKSTLSHLLANKMAENESVDERQYCHSHIMSRKKRAFIKCLYAAVYSFSHPLKIKSLLRKQYSVPFVVNYAYIGWLYQSKRTVILEQGICQLVMALFEDEGSTIDSIPDILPDILTDLIISKNNVLFVFVDASVDDIITRIGKRDVMDQPNIAKQMDVDKIIERLIAVLSSVEHALKSVGLKTIRVKNENEMMETAAEQIIVAVEEMR